MDVPRVRLQRLPNVLAGRVQAVASAASLQPATGLRREAEGRHGCIAGGITNFRDSQAALRATLAATELALPDGIV